MIDLHKAAIPIKLLWVDLEMSGLDIDKDVILEIAAEVTDFEFNILASYETVISHPEPILRDMDDWSKESHTKSGLIDRIKLMGRAEKEVEQELVEFIQNHFGDEPAVLAGNSIHNDRKFIRKHWPEVDRLLHYRMLDVSSFKILMQAKYGVIFEKEKAHRALDDIHGSIAELQYYLEFFNREKTS